MSGRMSVLDRRRRGDAFSERGSRTSSRALEVARSIDRPLLVLVAAGAVLRIATTAVYQPSVLQWVDAVRFARIDVEGLFDDFWMPPGYPVFLLGARTISEHLTVTVLLQHLVGIATAVLLWLAVRELGGPRWLALVPAGVVLLGGDYLYLEHILMAETLFTCVIAAGLYAAVRARHGEVRWLVASGVLIALAALVRNVGLVLVPVVGVWFLLLPVAGWLARVRRASLALVCSVLLLVGYAFVAEATGRYTGLGEMSGWNLYSRVAPFADCNEFDPPQGTRVLCESRPPEQRPGPFYYVWDTKSPARARWGLDPERSDELAAFARAAALAQPLDYLRAVTKDLARHVDPALGSERPYGGNPPELMSFEHRDAGSERLVTGWLETKYAGVEPQVSAGGVSALATYQRVFRLNGLLVLTALALALAGMALGRGPLRQGAVLFGLAAFALYLAPTATTSWDYRYGLPAAPFLVAAAALGGWSLVERRRLLHGGTSRSPTERARAGARRVGEGGI